jgi:Fe-S cluster assembly iron-binding protein IscA
MLVLTENATSVIRRIIDRPDVADGGGLRIATAAEGPDRLTVSAVDNPAADDVVIEDQGARVFLESDAAEMLDDKLLDVEVDDEGSVKFLLAGP